MGILTKVADGQTGLLTMWVKFGRIYKYADACIGCPTRYHFDASKLCVHTLTLDITSSTKRHVLVIDTTKFCVPLLRQKFVGVVPKRTPLYLYLKSDNYFKQKKYQTSLQTRTLLLSAGHERDGTCGGKTF